MNDLIKLETTTATELYTGENLDNILNAIEKEAENRAFDLTTKKGRSEISSFAMKISKSKVAMDTMGKSLTTEWREKTAKVNEERKKVNERLNALRDKIKAPLLEWEKIEEERVRKIKEKIKYILESGNVINIKTGESNTSEMIKGSMAELEKMKTEEVWMEFDDMATDALNRSMESLIIALPLALKTEHERLELKRLLEQEKKREEEEEKKANEAKINREIEERKTRVEAEKIENEKRKIEIEKKAKEEAEEKARKAIEVWQKKQKKKQKKQRSKQ